MSNIGLFAVGAIVTLLVASSIAVLVWGAILDGRDETERRAADSEASLQLLREQQTLSVVDAA